MRITKDNAMLVANYAALITGDATSVYWLRERGDPVAADQVENMVMRHLTKLVSLVGFQMEPLAQQEAAE